MFMEAKAAFLSKLSVNSKELHSLVFSVFKGPPVVKEEVQESSAQNAKEI